MTDNKRAIRVLIAKPGLDGHDVGAKILCRALLDAGMAVTYSGLRRSPREIVQAAERRDVDVLGLSILSGAHMALTEKVLEEVRGSGMREPLIIVGGNIPERDNEALEKLGVSAIFPTSTPFSEVVGYLNERVER